MAEQRSFADLHAHSSSSFDSLADPLRMLERARTLGLTHLAITDHERIDGALRAVEAAPAGMSVIVGEEIRTRDGDVIGLFLNQAVPPGLSAPDTVAAIHEQGGLAGLPHPFDGFRSSGGSKASGASDRLAGLAAVIDYVEVHNSRAYGSANRQAAAFARQHGLPGVAASDAHSVIEVGISSTVLPGPFSTAAELRELLPRATLVTSRTSYYVRLWTPLAKVVQRTRGNDRIRPSAAGTEDRDARDRDDR